MDKGNIALLIDFENVGNLDDLRTLMSRLSRKGNVVVKRAFGDWWSQPRDKQNRLVEMGVEMVHQIHSHKDKNASDIRLVIDAIELLRDGWRGIDTFVIASSDNDFLPLVVKLRASGKSVIVAAHDANRPQQLSKSADEYIGLGNGVPRSTVSVETRSSSSSALKKSVAKPNKPVRVTKSLNKDERRQKRKETQDLVLRAMNETLNGASEVSSTRLYGAMRRLDPNFSVKRMGYGRFAQLLNTFSAVVRVKKRKKSGDMMVRFSPNELKRRSGNV